MFGTALDQAGSQETRQAIADRSARHVQAGRHLDDRQGAAAADQIQQFSIRRLGQRNLESGNHFSRAIARQFPRQKVTTMFILEAPGNGVYHPRTPFSLFSQKQL
jgi:hypothetical protein